MEHLEVKFIWEELQREARENCAKTEGLPYIKRDGEIKKIYFRKTVTNNKVKYDSVCEIDNELVKYDSRTGVTEYGDQIYIKVKTGKEPKLIKHVYDFIWFYSDNISKDSWHYVEDLIKEHFDENADIRSYNSIKPKTHYYYDFNSYDFEELETNMNATFYGIEIKDI